MISRHPIVLASRKMRDLLSLIFSVLGFSGLGFWFRAKLFLGAERFVDLSTSVLRFEKFAQKMLLFCCSNTSSIFLHALSACMLLHGCRSECISCLLGSSNAARCFSLSISRPTHPVALASGFLAVPAFRFGTANLEFTLHSQACHFCRSALALLFHQPVVWAAALLLHFACSAAPAVRCTSCQTAAAPQSFFLGPPDLLPDCSCSSQAARPSQ